MSFQEKKAAIAQLLAHRETLAAALAQTDATLITLGVDLDGDEPAECAHPDEALVNRSTLGAPEFHCRGCGQTFDDHPHHSKE